MSAVTPTAQPNSNSSCSTGKKELVLVGGGHAHVLVLKHLATRPIKGLRITLVAKEIDTPYSGMLPGYIAGHYSREQCHIDLRRLTEFFGARLIHDEVTSLDIGNKQIICANNPPVIYDVMSIDIGSRPRQDDVAGAKQYATAVKPVDRFIERWERLVTRILGRNAVTKIIIVGGGAAGVELALAIQLRLHNELYKAGRNPDLVSISLVTMGDVAPMYPPAVQRAINCVLKNRKVTTYPHHEVIEVESGRLRCSNGIQIICDEILWATHAGAASWLGASGLECDQHGFVNVRETLQTVTDSTIFAAGDVANVIGHARPKAGVFAVRQGKPLAENLRHVLLGTAPRPFRPQRQYLSIISLGNRKAIGTRGNFAIQGKLVWRLKDWIDRRFMRQFQGLS